MSAILLKTSVDSSAFEAALSELELAVDALDGPLEIPPHLVEALTKPARINFRPAPAGAGLCFAVEPSRALLDLLTAVRTRKVNDLTVEGVGH